MVGFGFRDSIITDETTGDSAEVNTDRQLSVEAEIVDRNGLALELEANGAVPVSIQDQTSRALNIRMNKVLSSGITLAAIPVVNGYDITLSPGHGVSVGENITVLEQNGMIELLFGKVLSIAGDVITLDTPVPYAFSLSSTVFTYDKNMNKDGSVTPVVFSITNAFTVPVDIVRFIFHITAATSMDDSKFGGISALTRGIVLRKKISASSYINYWNVKTNGEFGEIAFDKVYDDKAPSGVYGLTVRITYGGQSKHGVVIRIDPGESIELVVQDDLTGEASFTMAMGGHVVTD